MGTSIYKVGGSRVPGVTTILSKFKDPGGLMHWAHNLGLEGKDYREERDKAASAGSMAHDMIECTILGKPRLVPTAEQYDLAPDVFEEMYTKALMGFTAFQDWASMTKLEIIATETALVSEDHKFGGTPDAVGIANGEIVLLDWKTSNRIYADYIVQVSAYCHLWRYGKMLHKDEKPPARLNEAIQKIHLLRFGKEWGDFHHHAWPREVMEIGWRQFVLFREAYDIHKRLEKAV